MGRAAATRTPGTGYEWPTWFGYNEATMRVGRLFSEIASVYRILPLPDFGRFVFCTLTHSPRILRTGRLWSVDMAMSRNIEVQYRGCRVKVPVRDIDEVLGGNDSPTFGGVRELCGRDCYFKPFRLSGLAGPFLDLGANRGMVSLLALLCLGSDRAIGVEPHQKYEPIFQLLLQANMLSASRAPRYTRFITSSAAEMRDPYRNVSIETIRREQGIDCFGLVKIDIEGGEIDLFGEPEWLPRVQNLCMEVHPGAGDLSAIPDALKHYGFKFVSVNQSGERCNINQSDFLYASRNGSLLAA